MRPAFPTTILLYSVYVQYRVAVSKAVSVDNLQKRFFIKHCGCTVRTTVSSCILVRQVVSNIEHNSTEDIISKCIYTFDTTENRSTGLGCQSRML